MYTKPSEQWWRVQALCRNHPEPDIWFPDRSVPALERRRNTAEAKAICHECPVFYACQNYALEALYGNGEEGSGKRFSGLQGIWAATDIGSDTGARRLRSVVQSPSPYGKIAVERAKQRILDQYKYHNGPLTA